jgi:hypothetical protein
MTIRNIVMHSFGIFSQDAFVAGVWSSLGYGGVPYDSAGKQEIYI